MNRVLVITDSEKVQKVFEGLEKSGALQLKTVSNLVQSDAEVAQFTPAFVFVQSRISGLSGEIVLRHLKKVLPADAKVAFLAVDSEDAAGSKKTGIPAVDLSEDDQTVSDGITDILSGVAPRARKKGVAEPVPAARGRGSKQKGPEVVIPSEGQPEVKIPSEGQPELETPAEGRPETGPPRGEQPEAEVPPEEQPEVETPSEETRAAEMAVPEKPSAEVAAEGKPFAEVAARERLETQPSPGEQRPAEEPAALPEPGPEATEPSPGPLPGGVASFEEMMRRAAEKGPVAAAPAEEVEDRVEVRRAPSAPMETPEPLAIDKKRPIWLFAVIVAVVALPLYYLVTSHRGPAAPPAVAPKGAAPAARTPAAPQAQPHAVPQAPAVSKVPAPATTPAAPAATGKQPAAPAKPAPVQPTPPSLAPGAPGRPVPAPPAAPAAQPAPPPAAPPRALNSSGKAGLKVLPPFLAGVTMDPLYARSHPGWQRYLGARAEYKLYREGDVYRAIQVIALAGQTVPDEIFRKVLREFGGIDSYRIESVENKQHYLVEHCAGPAGVGLTIYRKTSDARMKGFVLFYR